MGAGWVALLLFVFAAALGWFNKQLRDGRKQRRNKMQDWIDGHDE